MGNRSIYAHNDHFMYDFPITQGCKNWARIYPRQGLIKLQRLRTLAHEGLKIWPAEEIAVFRVKRWKNLRLDNVTMERTEVTC